MLEWARATEAAVCVRRSAARWAATSVEAAASMPPPLRVSTSAW